MDIEKFSHSCVRLTKSGGVLVIDPGTFSSDAELSEVLSGADAVIITHEHADHFHEAALSAALNANPNLSAWGPASVYEALKAAISGAEERLHLLEPGQHFTAAGFFIETFGGQHALIHPRIPVVDNVGVLVDGAVYHPGDALIGPDGAHVQMLLVPLSAPWSKLAEVIDFVTAVRPEEVYPIHDALLTPAAHGVYSHHVARTADLFGTTYRSWEPGQRVELG